MPGRDAMVDEVYEIAMDMARKNLGRDVWWCRMKFKSTLLMILIFLSHVGF